MNFFANIPCCSDAIELVHPIAVLEELTGVEMSFVDAGKNRIRIDGLAKARQKMGVASLLKRDTIDLSNPNKGLRVREVLELLQHGVKIGMYTADVLDANLNDEKDI